MEQTALKPVVSQAKLAKKYELKGEFDPFMKAELDKQYEGFPPEFQDMGEMAMEGLAEYREHCNAVINALSDNPRVKECMALCDKTEFQIPQMYDNDAPVDMISLCPKSLTGTGKSAMIFFHGGGCIAGSPEIAHPDVAVNAVEQNVMAFVIRYRLCPEGTADQIGMDGISAIKYLRDNCTQFGIDKEKIAIHGESGGGLAVQFVCGMLAKTDQSHLIKMATINVGIDLGYYIDVPQDDMPSRYAKDGKYEAGFLYKNLGTDWEAQWKNRDPVLFSSYASDEMIKKWPATVIQSGEFDPYVQANKTLADRLRQHGRLVEYVCYPGCIHAFNHYFDQPVVTQYFHDYKWVCDTYLHNDQ